MLLLLVLLQMLQPHEKVVVRNRGANHLTESLVEHHCVNSGYWSSVPHGPKAAAIRPTLDGET